MSLLIFALIVLILVALGSYVATLMSPPLDGNIVRLIQVAIVVIGIIAIADRAGLV